MRTMALMVLVGLAACGPSASEVRTAKTATYTAAPGQLLDAAIQVAKQQYKIGQVDPGHLRFETVPQFYDPNGGLESAGPDGYRNLVDHSVEVSFVVQVVENDAHQTMVTVTPHTAQSLAGSPAMRPLPPDDPNLPPWIHGRADALTLAIYKYAQAYAVPASGAAAEPGA